MATQPTTPPVSASLEQRMRANHVLLSTIFLIIAAALAAFPIWQATRMRNPETRNTILLVWGIWNVLIFLGAGLYLRFAVPETTPDGAYRILLLVMGGALGLGLFFLGVALPMG